MTKPVSVKVGNRRLLKLAAFLDALPRAKFDFSVIARQDGKPMLEALKAGKHRCGTVACAVGWMPAVFPRDLRWAKGYSLDVRFREDENTVNFRVAEAYFALSEAATLFAPCHGNGLDADAPPRAVARHIRKFVRQRAKAAA